MSLQKRISDSSTSTNTADITNNLNSLSYYHFLSADERKYSSLQVRHHAFTITSCAHAVYIVSVLNEIRSVLSKKRHPINKKTVQFIHQNAPRDPLTIGLIGCGRLGKQIVTSLFAFTDVKPEEIIVSTRRPESLVSFKKAGVRCIFDNKEVVRASNIVFLCCLPSHIPIISDDISDYVPTKCLLISLVTGISVHRLQQMFHHNNLSKVEFTWSMNNSLNEWCVGDDVKSALRKNWVASLACPVIGPNKNDGVVWPSSKTIETTLYAALNMFPTLNITTHEGLELLNIVFLTKSDDGSTKLTWSHFLDEHSLSLVDNGNLPIFDISRVAMHATPMTIFLNDQSNQDIHRLILKKFLLIFNRFQVKGS